MLAAGAAGACGKKGAPEPPLRVRPEAPRNLTIRQRGETVVVMLRVPEARTDGSAIDGSDDLLVRVTRLPAEAEEGDRSRGGRRRARRAPGAGAVSWIVPAAEWSRYRVANRLEIPIGVESLELPAGEAGATRVGATVAFAVEVQEGRRKRSEVGGPVRLTLCAPPPAPGDLEARLTDSGIVLWWSGGGEAAEQVHIYKAIGDAPFPARPSHRIEGSASAFLDAGVVPGQRLRYQVRFASGEKPLLCESVAGEAAAEAVDLFPPAPPRGLTAAAEETLIRLFWTPGSDPDLAGYLVYRSDGPEEPFRRLTPEALTETTYADTGVRSKGRYTYVVSAVDRATPPNESGWSAPAVESLP